MTIAATLSAGSAQTLVLAVTGSMSAIVLVFLAWAASKTRADIPYEQVSTVGYRFRRPWSLGLLLLLVVIGVISLLNLPSGIVRDKPADSTVKVTAAQFGFAINPGTVEAGTTVAFEVSSVDVNHGYGVYSPDGELLGQAQAMPGVVNRLVLDIDEPGTYEVLCMEYCGLMHHLMIGKFEAVKGASA